MSNSISERVYRNLKPGHSIESNLYQILGKLFETVFGKHSYRLPKNGDVARAEHITEPFNHMYTISGDVQEALGELRTDTDLLTADIVSSTDELKHQLNYLKSEVNYWKLFNGDSDVITVNESLSTSLMLPIEDYTNSVAEGSNIAEVIFDPESGQNKESNKISGPYFAFGDPFGSGIESQPHLALISSVPLQLQGVQIDTSDTDIVKESLAPFERQYALLSTNTFIWHQVDSSNLSLSGRLIIKLVKPVQLSMIEFDTDQQAMIHSISVFDEHLYETRMAGAEELVFYPKLVKEIHIVIKDNVSAAHKLAYTIQAMILNIAGISGSSNAYVYYIDEAARKLV